MTGGRGQQWGVRPCAVLTFVKHITKVEYVWMNAMNPHATAGDWREPLRFVIPEGGPSKARNGYSGPMPEHRHRSGGAEAPTA